MRCRTAIRYISLKLDNELEPRRIEILGRHLASCPKCQKEYREMADLQSSLSQLKDSPVPGWLAPKVMLNLPQKRQPFFILPKGLAYTAASLAIAISIFAGGSLGHKGIQISQLIEEQESISYAGLSFGENSFFEVYDE